MRQKQGIEKPCRDCGTPVYLSPRNAARLKREPFCKPCYQRHHEAVLAGTRLRVQTCEKCQQRFDAAHRRRFCPTCSPIQWDGKSMNATCVVCGKPYAHPDPSKRKTCSHECSRKNWNAQRRGDKSRFWKGGVSTAEQLARKTVEYKDWRAAVLVRDNATCQMCSSRPKAPDVHHIHSFVAHPDKRTDVMNGITLCRSCHASIQQHEEDYIPQFEAIVRSKAALAAVPSVRVEEVTA